MLIIISVILSAILIKPAELADLLRPVELTIFYYPCGALNDCCKICGALRFNKSLRSYDVDYYACGALNDFNKTCGALRPLKILRS